MKKLLEMDESGAVLDAADREGRRALEHALATGDEAVIALLIKAHMTLGLMGDLSNNFASYMAWRIIKSLQTGDYQKAGATLLEGQFYSVRMDGLPSVPLTLRTTDRLYTVRSKKASLHAIFFLAQACFHRIELEGLFIFKDAMPRTLRQLLKEREISGRSEVEVCRFEDKGSERRFVLELDPLAALVEGKAFKEWPAVLDAQVDSIGLTEVKSDGSRVAVRSVFPTGS